MFGWRRKSDGFEWHEYVRTTIKLRREDRRKRLEDIRLSAVEGAKNVGQAGADAGRSAMGRSLAFVGALPGRLWQALKYVGSGFSPLYHAGGRGLSRSLHAAAPIISRPGIAPLMGLIGLAAAASATAGWWSEGWHPQTIVSAVVAAICLVIAFMPLFSGTALSRRSLKLGVGVSWPNVHALPTTAMLTIVAAVLTSLGAAAIWMYGPTLSLTGTATSIANVSPFVKTVVQGRAKAITGDTLLIDGKYVRLGGIEAPELAQRCKNRRGRRWRCGRSARSALAKLVSRRSITCTITGKDKNQFKNAKCEANGRDIGEQLTRAGHVFANGGLFAGYSSAERVARDAKSGIWRGAAQRPVDFRSAQWDRAKKRAPDGCPIKGRVSSKGKVYLVPWSPRYRRERIDPNRGERWFCSERDALAAGWQADPAG